MKDIRAQISGLYAIADSAWNPRERLTDLVAKFLEGGCRLIQLRMKDATRESVLDEARQIMSFKKNLNFTFIINDHADIVFEVGADGVHVGAGDQPVAGLRKKYGDEMIIGYSSHSFEEARRAVDDGADYVAFGAIFPTKTKGPGHPVQGVGRLKELVRSIEVPVVAIGGIDRGNFRQMLETGASAVAMIRALSTAGDIVAETRWFVEETIRGDL